MTVQQKRFLYFSVLTCFLTGLGIFVLEQFFEVVGDFGFEEHWLLDDFKSFHYIFTPFLIVSFGLLWQGHISKGFYNKRRPKRASGLLILLTMIVLVFTGQMLLSLVSTGLRDWVGWVHSGAGLLICLGMLRHAFSRA